MDRHDDIQPRIIRTRDGSDTLYVPHLNEHYHSIHGAVTESLHVFIGAGLQHLLPTPPAVVRILEIGFGTGLNAWLTALESITFPAHIHYVGVENHPLPQDILSEVGYHKHHRHDAGETVWSALHAASWQQETKLLPSFTLLKWAGNWQQEAPDTSQDFHLIYYDAFAPDKQPDMWTPDLFDRCFQLLSPGGILVTYTSKGVVRRMLQAAGFVVEKEPGPPGKREMLRATKPDDDNSRDL